MGFHGFSFGSLILIIILAILLFGTKRLRSFGEDLGAAFKSFRKGLQEDETTEENKHKLKTDPNDSKNNHV